MSDKLNRLLSKKIISKSIYDTYLLFELNELGRNYLNNSLDSIYMEQPEESNVNDPYPWHDGRRSVWRDIKIVIEKVKIELEKSKHDRDNKPRSNN